MVVAVVVNDVTVVAVFVCLLGGGEEQTERPRQLDRQRYTKKQTAADTKWFDLETEFLWSKDDFTPTVHLKDSFKLTTHLRDNSSLTVQVKDDICLTVLFKDGFSLNRRFLAYVYPVLSIETWSERKNWDPSFRKY